MFPLPKPSTKFVVPDMVLTLTFINVNLRKYFLSQRIVRVVSQSVRHTSSSFILRPNNTWILDTTNIKKTRHNINNNIKENIIIRLNIRNNNILFDI